MGVNVLKIIIFFDTPYFGRVFYYIFYFCCIILKNCYFCKKKYTCQSRDLVPLSVVIIGVG
ncbi:hypothetical protein KCTC52924_02377 [Arenibacter antarcticus]